MIKSHNKKHCPKVLPRRELCKKITTVTPKGYFYEITDRDDQLVIVGVDGKEVYPAVTLTVKMLKDIVSQPMYKIQMKNVSRIQAAELKDAIKIVKNGMVLNGKSNRVNRINATRGSNKKS